MRIADRNRCIATALLAAMALLATTFRSAEAGVTFFGSVDPDPPGDGDVEQPLVIGLLNDDVDDRRGYVLIDDGTSLEYDSLIVGDDEGYRGLLTITGMASSRSMPIRPRTDRANRPRGRWRVDRRERRLTDDGGLGSRLVPRRRTVWDRNHDCARHILAG